MISRVLAFDTSTDVTAVAVLRDGRVLAQDSTPSSERHAQLLLPRVNACLAAAQLTLADLDLFAVGVGPGSFVGVRVGLATAKGLALALDKPIRGVLSLEALAQRGFDPTLLDTALSVPILDAHKGEVFAAGYSRSPDGELVCVLPPFHAPPVEAATRIAEAASGRTCRVYGAGYRRYPEAFPFLSLSEGFDTPTGVAIAQCALRDFARDGASDLASLVPEYLRGSDAQLPKAPLRL